MSEPVTLDFETAGIELPPNYPPEPVGLAARLPELGSVYLAWGHPEGNNCSKQTAYDLLQRVWGGRTLFHNGRFDIAVANKHFGLKWPEASQVEDTLYQLFLMEPLASTLSLKPSAARILNMPPDEQDAVREWLVAHNVVHAGAKDWGAHISKAPAGVVGRYAIGDVERTYRLHQHLLPQIVDQCMQPAYEREKLLAPILNANEAEGVYIDLPQLEKDYAHYMRWFDKCAKDIFKRLGCSEFNLNSGTELAEAIQRKGCHTHAWPTTPTGKLSTARDVLHSVITDPELFSLVAYWGILKTCTGTFMGPWLLQARETGGKVHPQWNAVRGDFGGTRTGRMSSFAPNFQNIPVDFPETLPKGYPPLPVMRKYVLPRPGEVFIKADFHSQEVRVLGHFAEGAIASIYRDDPAADVHAVAAGLIQDATGVVMDRKQVKIIAFSILYGAGVGRIADGLGVDRGTAARMKSAYLATLTGVREFQREVERRASMKQSVTSWGGRVLHAPAPVINKDGGVWNKDYVLINYLVQGSAADQTKEALIRNEQFYITVHDEICDSAKPKHVKSTIKKLRWAMEEMAGWDIPMRAQVSTGPNWATLEEYSK